MEHVISNKSGEHPATIVPLIGGATRPPQHIEPEFVDCPGAYHLFGLRRSMLYELNARGVIRGVSLRKRGAAKGKRLWSCDSIRAYLRAEMGGGNETS